MNVLGLDPGFAATGWAIVSVGDRDEYRFAGTIRTEPSAKKRRLLVSDDNLRRALEIAKALEEIVEKCKPVAVCLEGPAGTQSYRAAFGLGVGTGLVAYMLRRHELPVRQISPQELKYRLCGSRNADKDAVAAAVLNRFPMAREVNALRKQDREHAFDALGAVIACFDEDVVRMARLAEKQWSHE